MRLWCHELSFTEIRQLAGGGLPTLSDRSRALSPPLPALGKSPPDGGYDETYVDKATAAATSEKKKRHFEQQRQKIKRGQHRSAIINAVLPFTNNNSRNTSGPVRLPLKPSSTPVPPLSVLSPTAPAILTMLTPPPAFVWHSLLKCQKEGTVEVKSEQRASNAVRESHKKNNQMAPSNEGSRSLLGNHQDGSRHSDDSNADGTFSIATSQAIEMRPHNALISHVSRSVSGGSYREEQLPLSSSSSSSSSSAAAAAAAAAAGCTLPLVRTARQRNEAARAPLVSFGEPPQWRKARHGGNYGIGFNNAGANDAFAEAALREVEVQVEGESKGETAVKEGMEAQWRRRVEREEKISVQQYLGAVNTTEQLGSRQLDNRSSSVQDTSSNNSVPPEMKTARGGVRTPQSLTRRRDRWFRGTASVSMVVWAEDASDELRADVGQVEALW